MRIFLIFISALLFALAGGFILFFLGFLISIWIVPNNIDGHVEMAIPQLFTGMLVGIIGFIFILIFSFKKLKKKINQ